MNLVEFPLTPEQKALLAPIVRAASAKRRNILFLATAAPSPNGSWRLQVANVAPATGSKILGLISPKKEAAL